MKQMLNQTWHQLPEALSVSRVGDPSWLRSALDTKMIRPSLSLGFLALTLLASGCRTPMKVHLARYPHWEQAAQRITVEKNSERAGLVWMDFPDPQNPVHREIWKALWDNNRIGDGLGSICNYYGFYLLTLSEFYGHERTSSFYDPTRRHIFLGDTEHLAFSFYGGERKAAIGNVRRLVEHLLAVSGYGAFIVDDCNQVPHTAFQIDNPNLPFADYLTAKGITIRPPSILSKNEQTDFNGYSECSVFAYKPLGGQILRYEVRCENGKITAVKRFTLGTDIGDCWYIM